MLSVSKYPAGGAAPSTFVPFTGGYTNLMVTSGTTPTPVPYLYWKRPMNLLFLEDNLDQTFSGQPARAGDSVEFQGYGFTPSNMSVSINGHSLSSVLLALIHPFMANCASAYP